MSEQAMRDIFERAIRENPDDLGHHAAYADWLAEQGDPRGEWMQVQIALEDTSLPAVERDRLRKREQQVQDAHLRTWLGDLAPFLLDASENPAYTQDYSWLTEELLQADPTLEDTRREALASTPPNCRFRFARGWLDTLHINTLTVSLARALRDAPIARMLRELEIELVADRFEDTYEPGDDVPEWEQGYCQFVGAHPLRGASSLANLRMLRIGEELDTEGDLHFPMHVHCHVGCPVAAELTEMMPRLEELHLLCKEVDLKRLFRSTVLDRLRVLRVYHMDNPAYRGTPYPLRLLARNPTFQNLTHLRFHPHYSHPNHSFLPREEVRALLESPHLGKLGHLQLRLSDVGDLGCQFIALSGFLNHLRVLDLSHGCITDAGARLLARAPAFRNLERFIVRRNGLTQAGIAALETTGAEVIADHQLTPQQLNQQEFLQDGDFE